MSGGNGSTTTLEQFNVGTTVATIPEFNRKRVSLASGTEKDISGRGCALRAVYVNTAPAAAVTINGATDSPFVIPAGVAAGTFMPFGDVVFKNRLTITHTAGVGDLTFIFKSF